ncbi:MAG: transposase [Thermoleophilia bacterium]
MSILYTAAMPRQPRIDAPGLLCHVIVRGTERKPIFRDDGDRQFFLSRLGTILQETGTPIYAFALIPNHFHLLLRRGEKPVSKFMQRLLTGYAMHFNKRHRRVGHLFQNRYKSIICQEDLYFLSLIRYINLNPLRAGIVKSHEDLESYRYASHSYVMGRRKTEWFEPDAVLSMFGTKRRAARAAYLEFITEVRGEDGEQDLDGGGLIRTLGCPDRFPGKKQAYDERILGIGDFVEGLTETGDEVGLGRPADPQELLDQVGREHGIPKEQLTSGTMAHRVVGVRRVLAYRLSTEARMSGCEIARMLNLSQSTASRLIRQGEELHKR